MSVHEHNHEHHHEHNHEHNHEHEVNRVRLKAVKAAALGEARVKCNIHDEAIVISGTLTVETSRADFDGAIARKLEDTARAVKERGAIVGHIKASASVTMTQMYSVTDEDAQVKHMQDRRIKLELAAIVFQIEPAAAETLIKTALNELAKEI